MRSFLAPTMRTLLAAMLLVAAAAGVVAQLPPPPHALPPLLYLRIVGPKGMKVTLYRGDRDGVDFDAPCVIGVRPGYGYRFALHNLADFPGATFYPSIDVRGSLWLSHQLRNANFPATIVFHKDDFAKVEKGALIRKVIVLEDPETAEARQAPAEGPIEVAVPGQRELQHEIQARGAAVAYVTLGQRTFSQEELAAAAVPGTLLLPGDKVLGPPRQAPWFPWTCVTIGDPRAGTPSPAAFSHLYDGGDSGLRAGFDGSGKLRGVDPSDTVAEYTDSHGRPRVVASNRVALCVPRFVVLRTETGLVNQIMALGPSTAQSQSGTAGVAQRLPIVENNQPVRVEAAASRQRPSGTEFTSGLAIRGMINGLVATTTLRHTSTVDGSCPPPTTPTLDLPLKIIKWPDKLGCNVGDLVTFSIRYFNQGTAPITNVAVVDSLTPRFDYVEGSQKTDREATFTAQPNEAGSSTLRWEFPGVLRPGESGLITFQVRIR
ncbi:MAG: DUF11 domain-containing protein [Gemmataceae bacterium]|nr:DUF11 domain-containing protein [Gemmataceae bacterium]